MKRHFKSGMLQSWNKFCFTGGIIEVDVQFPGTSSCYKQGCWLFSISACCIAILSGRYDVGGLWPAVWMLGNLGRATYEASTNLLW